MEEQPVTRTLDRLEIPETDSPHAHLLNFACDDFDQDNDDQDVFLNEEMTQMTTVVPSLRISSRNGICEVVNTHIITEVKA